jgi:hypothetical protein
MKRMLELPDALYDALHAAASARGWTPAEWIAAHLPSPGALTRQGADPEPRTAADQFAGRVGRIHSGGRERLSEDTGGRFADHVEEKRRGGRL